MNEKNTDLQEQVAGDIRLWQQELILGVMRTLALVGLPLIILLLYDTLQNRLWGAFALYGGAYVLLLIVTWRRTPYIIHVSLGHILRPGRH